MKSSNIIGALALVISASTANAGDKMMTAPVRLLNAEQVKQLCIDTKNKSRIIVNGTEICEISIDDGKTWMSYASALAARLLILGTGGILLYRNRGKIKPVLVRFRNTLPKRKIKNIIEKPDSEVSEKPLNKGKGNLGKQVTSIVGMVGKIFSTKKQNDTKTILETLSQVSSVPDNIAYERAQKILESRMEILKNAVSGLQKDPDNRHSDYNFHTQSVIVLAEDSKHSAEDRAQVRQWKKELEGKDNESDGDLSERIIDPKFAPISSDIDKGNEESLDQGFSGANIEIEDHAAVGPLDVLLDGSGDGIPENIIVSLPVVGEDLIIDDAGIETASDIVDRSYIVGQALIKGHEKNNFITHSLPGDCIRMKNLGTLTKLENGRWKHVNGGEIEYFETNAELIEKSWCGSGKGSKHFTIDSLGNKTYNVRKTSKVLLQTAPSESSETLTLSPGETLQQFSKQNYWLTDRRLSPVLEQDIDALFTNTGALRENTELKVPGDIGESPHIPSQSMIDNNEVKIDSIKRKEIAGEYAGMFVCRVSIGNMSYEEYISSNELVDHINVYIREINTQNNYED